MRIDCATCPGRGRACDGCLMQVFFAPATRGFDPGEDPEGAVRDLHDAVDVLAATALISPTVAKVARRDIDAGGGAARSAGRGFLRAVG